MEGALLESAAAPRVPAGITHLVLIGTPDPSTVCLQAVAAVVPTLDVQVVVYGPADRDEVERSFDAWGRPRSGAWAQRELDWGTFEEHVHLHADPASQARQVVAVASEIPQMTVLGIAGPGDALANPKKTFDTMRALSEKAPDIKLCLSTNGLALPQMVDEICRYNIDHVTITINCVDPAVGARIYPWIFWKNRRVFGHEAAAILIGQQQKGLEMLTARGIPVIVSSLAEGEEEGPGLRFDLERALGQAGQRPLRVRQVTAHSRSLSNRTVPSDNSDAKRARSIAC